MIDPKLAAIFREEAAEHLDVLERLLLAIEAGHEDPASSIDECFRRAHTLKGAARAVGLAALQQAAHDLEDLLNPYRGGAKALTADILKTALGRLDGMRRIVAAATGPAPADEAKVASDAAQTVSSGGTAPAAESAAAGVGTIKPGEPSVGGLRIDSARLDRMIGLLGNIQISHKAGDKLGSDIRHVLDVLGHAGQDLDGMETRIRQTDRVDPDAVIRSIQEARLAIRATTESLTMMRSNIESRQSEQSLLLTQLDDEVRRARLVPLSTLSLLLERACRDAAMDKKIKIAFAMTGGDVTLDRAVIDAIQEPLLHLVRNAVAHAIESADARLAAGKAAEGAVVIDARRTGNRVRIRVRDDGRGIDLARIRALAARRARSGGAAEPDARTAEVAADDALLDELFRGGISTSAAADMLSGRGAGLEIARTRVRALQGDIRVLETGPRGTVFEMNLPVHLQIMRIMAIRSASGFFGIPTAAILQTRRVLSADIRMIEGRHVLPTNEGPIPLVPLDTAMGMPERARPAAGVGVILESGARRVAMLVDEIIEETEVLIRELGYPLAHISNVAGAAVRPDGSVLLILNPVELSEQALGIRSTAAAPAKAASRPRILVVDDSPTTRSVLRGLFSAAGFDVTVAADGVEGHSIFVQQGADVVVTDIQMPRMDGFAFTRVIKTESRGRTPVVLVTGRESEADRREGLEAGADAYVVKSTFEESDLIETVRRFL